MAATKFQLYILKQLSVPATRVSAADFEPALKGWRVPAVNFETALKG